MLGLALLGLLWNIEIKILIIAVGHRNQTLDSILEFLILPWDFNSYIGLMFKGINR